MNNKFGQRYIQATKFCDYANVIIAGKSISLHDLEFLEREQLLLPVCRVRFPEKVVRKFWVDENSNYEDASLPVEADQKALHAVQVLSRRIDGWGTACLKPHRIVHPLDEVDSGYQAFVQSTFTSENFKPWSTFKTVVGKYENGPLYESCVYTYYHYWQVLMLAEIYNMEISMILNLADDKLSTPACEGNIGEIPAERFRASINLRGLHSFREFPDYRNVFEALAFFLSYSNLAQFRASMKVEKNVRSAIVSLEGEVLSEFITERDKIARKALARWDLKPQNILEFIKWQSKQWNEWNRLDRQLIAKEYKRNINAAINYYMLISGKEYDQVIKEVGRVTGHFKQTLDVIFPQWISEQKDDAITVFKSWIMPTTEGFSLAGHNISEDECSELVDWIVEEEQIQFLWYIEQVNKHWKYADAISLTVLAKTVEGLSSSFEHVLNLISSQANEINKNRLFGKIKWLWEDVKCVVHMMGSHSELTRSDGDFKGMWFQINDLSMKGEYLGIVQDLLKVVLIRNHGLHLGFKQFEREELLEFSQILLRNVLLAWKHAKMRGFLQEND